MVQFLRKTKLSFVILFELHRVWPQNNTVALLKYNASSELFVFLQIYSVNFRVETKLRKMRNIRSGRQRL
jgi:hypothetical protein